MGDQWNGAERRGSGREDLVSAIAAAIRVEMAGLTVPEDMHREHHDFIRTWIEREKTKAERRERLREKVSGWLIITLLGAIGTGAYNLANMLRNHWK